MDETIETVGIIEQVFTEDEDVVNNLVETNIIDEPDADPTIPTEDQDTGGGGDSSPVTVIDGDSVEPDEEDIINSVEDNDLTEPEIAVDAPEVTPIVSNEEVLPTIGNVSSGDRVMIALINGEATVLGTVGSGDRQQTEINTISADVAELGTVVAGKASIGDLNTQTARIDSLETNKADVSDLTAATARIDSLETNKADVSDLTAATARIGSLETDNTSIKGRLTAAEGNITTLTSDKANVSDLTAATGRITSLETDNTSVKNRLTAAEGNITTLTTNKADISALNAATARIGTLETNALTADSAVITNLQTNKVNVSDLQADYITANQIAAAYAKVDATNINTATIRSAWLDSLMVQTGLLAQSGTIYTLDAIQLNADRITAGTIDVQRLLVTVNNHKYLVQFDAQGNPTYVKLDGDAIEDLTITADKIVAGAITADKITTNNLVGTGGWINLRSGTFNYSNATSGNGIGWDGTDLSIVGGINITNQLDIIKNGISVAEFGSSGARIGSSGGGHSIIKADGMTIYANDGTNELANIGYGLGNGSSGQMYEDAYYTFGSRKTTTDAYDNTQLYEIGDVILRNGSIYACNTFINTPETYHSSHWDYYIGNSSFAEGKDVVSSGIASHAEGYMTVSMSNGSHTEGQWTYATFEAAHAEGNRTQALERYTHAEGFSTLANGYISHAEGGGSNASGQYSHAEGRTTNALGNNSHSQNYGTIAQGFSQTAIGKFNVASGAADSFVNTDYAFIIGNGADKDNRSNALTVDWDGNLVAAGNITDGSGNTLSQLDSDLDSLTTTVGQHTTKLNNIGTAYENTKSVAITTANINTYAEGAKVTLPAGTYVIVGQWAFNSVSGSRTIDVDITDTGGTAADSTPYARQRVTSGGGNWAQLQAFTIITLTQQTIVYVKGSATVTSTAQSTRIRAIRIA